MDSLSRESTGCHAGSQKRLSSQDAAKSSMPSRSLIFLLAITAGLVAMNVYYNQPILNEIAATFKIASSAVAWVAIATQLGYAAGLLFVLPIGDSFDRKHLTSLRPSHLRLLSA
jgi:predicted MFS family arabinose efflux permease